jgi:hypothetical protein
MRATIRTKSESETREIQSIADQLNRDHLNGLISFLNVARERLRPTESFVPSRRRNCWELNHTGQGDRVIS